MPTQLKGSHYFAKQSFAELNIREYTVRRSSRAPAQHCPPHNAGVAELVDAPDSKSGFFGSGGSIPPLGTILELADNMKFCPECGGTVSHRIPKADNRERAICDDCDTVHYKNPIIVVGCVVESEGKILLCKRSIEPRYGYWTIPAGFMELGETLAGGAARETLEEACATIEIGHQFASVDVVDAGQVHVFFTGKLVGGFGVGEESLDTRLYSEDEIPWDDLAFHSGRFALQKYFEDRGENNGVHFHELRRSNS